MSPELIIALVVAILGPAGLASYKIFPSERRKLESDIDIQQATMIKNQLESMNNITRSVQAAADQAFLKVKATEHEMVLLKNRHLKDIQTLKEAYEIQIKTLQEENIVLRERVTDLEESHVLLKQELEQTKNQVEHLQGEKDETL